MAVANISKGPWYENLGLSVRGACAASPGAHTGKRRLTPRLPTWRRKERGANPRLRCSFEALRAPHPHNVANGFVMENKRTGETLPLLAFVA